MNEHDNANQASFVAPAAEQVAAESTGVALNAPAFDLQGQHTDPNPVLGSDENRKMAVQYELIAHGFAYSDQLKAHQSTLAKAMGFKGNWSQTSNIKGGDGEIIDENANTGFFTGLLLPNNARQPGDDEFSLETNEQSAIEPAAEPVLAFRGSETGAQFKLDWYNNDMDPIAVGYTAFMLNIDKVQNMLAAAVQATGKRVTVTGHSLGGSLAKQAALHFPQFISNCYTYQAPGIAAAQQQYLELNMAAQGNINGDQMADSDRTALTEAGISDIDTHGFDDINFEAHTAEGDIVNYAGGGRVPGPNSRRIKHDPAGVLNGLTPVAHTLMLTSSNEFSREHAALHEQMLQVDPTYSGSIENIYADSKDKQVDFEAMDIDNPARNTTDTVHESIESVRASLIAEMFNPHSELINNFPERIPKIPMASRIIILRSLLNGPGVIESLTKGAGVGMGITALIAAPGTVLGMIGGAAAGFAEHGGDSTAGTVASTAGGAAAGGMVGAKVDGILSMIPLLRPLQTVLAPVAGVFGGLAYSYFALSNDINETQEAALKMLTFSEPGEQKDLIQGVGGATVFYHKMDTIINDFFGSDVFDRTRGQMIGGGGYFSQLNASEAASEISDNLDGGFLGFGDNTQEKIIADVLVYGVVGNEALTILGDGDYDEGLEIVLKKLQGREDRMVSDKFDFTDGRWRWTW